MYNYSLFSLVREGETEALKCKVVCANHHLQQHSPSAVIPGEAMSYLRGKELCPSCPALPCPHGASRAQPCPGAPGSAMALPEIDGILQQGPNPLCLPKHSSTPSNRHVAHAALAGLSQFTPLSSTAQDIYYFKLNYYFKT